MSFKKSALLLWPISALAWASIAYYIFSINIGAESDIFAVTRLLYYGLLVIAPVTAAIPICRLTDSRIFWFESLIYWAGLLYMFTFVPPDRYGLPGYLLFMVMLFGACYTIFMPIGYAIGFRLFTLRAHKRDVNRARREAYLLALFLALSAAMNVAGLFNLINAVLLLLILILIELFALAHKSGSEA